MVAFVADGGFLLGTRTGVATLPSWDADTATLP